MLYRYRDIVPNVSGNVDAYEKQIATGKCLISYICGVSEH